MDKKIVKNYFYTILYQLLIIFTPFITTPYLTRVMGADALSINTWTSNIVQWFVLFGIMGVNHYGNKEIAKVRDDKKELSKTFFEIFCMQFINMILALLAFVIFINTISVDYHLIFKIQCITLLSVALDITWFFYGVENFKTASIRNMIVKIVGIILIFTFVKDPSDLSKFVLINTTTGVLGQLIMWVQLRHYICFVKISFKDVIKHLKPNIELFIPQIAISVYSILDITMLGSLYPDLKHVEFYEQSQKFVKMFLFFITSIGSVMLPRVTNVFHKKEYEKANAYLNKTIHLAIYLSIPMIAGIISLIENFIVWFLPPEFYVVSRMIIYTTPIIFFISLSNVFGIQYMIPVGITNKYTISVVSGAVTNCLVNFFLIPKFGAYGAIVGSVSAELVVVLVQYHYVKNQLKLHVKKSAIMRVIFASCVMGFAVHFTGKIGSNIAVNFLQVLVGATCYFSMLLIMKDEFLISMLKSLKRDKNA